jgi:lysophospholipase L1-like esterase
VRGRRLAILVAATAIGLLGVEGGLRLFALDLGANPWLTTSERGYAVNRRSISAAHHNTLGRRVIYRLNSLGFRGAEPARDGKRVLVVGDSMTFGWLVDEPDTYVSRLASSAAAQWGAGIQFMNAAVAGWGTADYVAFVEDEGDQLRPDVVLVFIGLDDVRRTWISPLWEMTPDDTVLRRPQSEVRPGVHRLANLPLYRFVIERSHAAQLVRRAGLALSGNAPSIAPDDTQSALRLTHAVFERLSEWCRSRGITLLVTNGTLLELEGDADHNPNAIFLKDADAFFARLRVPYLSIARAHGWLAEPLASLVIADDVHLNERGNQLLFDAVWPWLRDQLRVVVDRPRP